MESQILLVAVSLLLTFSAVVTENTPDCPLLYQRYSDSHSYCQPKNASCNILQSGVNAKEKLQIVQIHNRYRSAIAKQKKDGNGLPPAADMIYMEWDDELAKVAQRHAEQCKYKHDGKYQRKVRNFSVGQNIAKQEFGGVTEPIEPDWPHIMELFFEEIEYFSSEMVCGSRSHTEGVIGHFTQIIWSKTFKVGCGYTQYKDGDSIHLYYVCNYGPAGNGVNCVYEIGPACSKCSSNAKCTEDGEFAGLCKLTTSEAPYTPITVPTIFNCDFRDGSPDCAFANVEGPWKVLSSLSGNYAEVVLQPGENGSITFAKVLTPSAGTKSLCVRVKYRKGANFVKDKQMNEAKGILIVPSMNNWTAEFKFTDYDEEHAHTYSFFNLNLGSKAPAELKITFSVPSNAPPQFFNIASIIGFDNKCQKVE